MSSATDNATRLDGTHTVKKRPTNALIINWLAEAYGTDNEVIVPVTLIDGREVPIVVGRLDTINGIRCIRGKLAESRQTAVILELGGVNRGELRVVAKVA